VGLNHLAFQVESRAAVDALRAWCRKKKIPMLYDERYPFATGGADQYALFVKDPDWTKVEFVVKILYQLKCLSSHIWLHS
jgi:hypothetical protein